MKQRNKGRNVCIVCSTVLIFFSECNNFVLFKIISSMVYIKNTSVNESAREERVSKFK